MNSQLGLAEVDKELTMDFWGDAAQNLFWLWFPS